MPRQSEFTPYKQSKTESATQNLSSIDPKLSRSHYFDGRLLKASDLIRDQHYLDERLHEVGRVLGQGVVKGLHLSLSELGVLSVSPGLAVSASGKVLELEKQSLSIDLYDSAQISVLNDGQQYFERGLYIVALEYAQIGSGSTEIYPKDLIEKRGFHFNAFAEGVELVLEPLHTRGLSYRTNPVNDKTRLSAALSARAALVRELIDNPAQPSEVSFHGVALGIMSIEAGRVAWIDTGLVRRPLRALNQQNQLQQDLHNHYAELLQDIDDLHRQSAREYPFAATDYFSLLPPFGEVPKRCIDPLTASQQYFPKHFDVQITPVRQADLTALFEESESLPIIDLEDQQPLDIMLLIPLSDHQFTRLARVLEQFVETDASQNNIKYIPSLALQLYGDDRLQSDSLKFDAWQSIWQKTEQVFFVRRPARVAQTQVNAVVLAQGYEPFEDDQGGSLNQELIQMRARVTQALSEISTLTTENRRLQNRLAEIEDGQGSGNERLQAALIEIERLNERSLALSDERDRLQLRIDLAQVLEVDLRAQINRLETSVEDLKAQLDQQGGGENLLSIEEILSLRGGENLDPEVVDSGKALSEAIKDDKENLNIINRLAVSIDKRYDTVLWKTILALVEKETLSEFFDEYQDMGIEMGAETFLLELGTKFGLEQSLIEEWAKLSQSFRSLLLSTNEPSLSTQSEIKEGLSKLKVADLKSLARRRSFNDDKVIEKILKAIDSSKELTLWVNQICYLIPPHYDDILWRSMIGLIEGDHTKSFKEYVIRASLKTSSIGLSIAATTAFKMSVSVRNKWRDKDIT